MFDACWIYPLEIKSYIYIYLASTIQVPWLSTSHPTLNFHKQSLPGREPGWLRSKMSAMIVGLQCHNSIAGLISQDHFKKKHGSHQQDWKTGFPFGWFEKKKWAQVWNWPNGRWSFTPPSPQEVSPPSQLRSLCNSCHRLLLSHARCPDKKFGQGFLGSLCMRLYYSKRIPIANLIWSPATRWCIYIYIACIGHVFHRLQALAAGGSISLNILLTQRSILYRKWISASWS